MKGIWGRKFIKKKVRYVGGRSLKERQLNLSQKGAFGGPQNIPHPNGAQNPGPFIFTALKAKAFNHSERACCPDFLLCKRGVPQIFSPPTTCLQPQIQRLIYHRNQK